MIEVPTGMTVYPFCHPYVWENPKVLMYTGFTVQNRKEGACVSEYVNHIIYIYSIFFVIGGALTVLFKNNTIFSAAMALATLYCIPTLWRLAVMQKAKEGFADAATPPPPEEYKCDGGPCDAVYDVIGRGAANATLTLPTKQNPFMNVLIDEIKYNPKKPTAMSVMDPSAKVHMDEFFRTEFFSDPTDVFGKSQSQRQFITMPSTSIPNDVQSYRNWLYKIDGPTCKEGSRQACLPGTDGGAIPWLNGQTHFSAFS
jgi:hypothetical protein